MKKIKIFLGSSIVEFEKERNELELFIRNLSDKFEDNYGIKIVPLRCENMDNYVRADGTQSAINEELVRESDMCFFIFFTRVGEYTEEEFRVALEKYKEDGKPKIYIYFKTIPCGVNVDESIRNFMLKIDEELKHYHGTFDHIDTIKLRILLNLKIQEMDFVSLKIENGKCAVDGYDALEIKNVNEFANNGVLQELNDELHKAQELYLQMKPIYDSGRYSSSFYKEYITVSTKVQSLSASINELEKRIFEISLRLCKDDVHGVITVRQKEAYRLFELGDYEGCLRVLDKDEINNDFFSFETKEYEKIKRKAECFIREHMTAIHLLYTYDLERPIDCCEIEERFECIVPVCKKYKIELNAIREYAKHLSWLESNNPNCSKALNLANDLEEIYLFECDTVPDREWLELKILYGYIYERLIGSSSEYTSTYCLDKSLKYYEEAQKIIESNKEEEDILSRLPAVLNDMGNIYYEKEEYELALECFFKVLDLMKKSIEESDSPNYEELSFSYCMIAKCYETQNETIKAEEYFEHSLEICCKDEVSNKSWIINKLYLIYCSFGEFYLNSKKDEIEKAEVYLIKALTVCHILASVHPSGGTTIHKLVETLIDLGEYYIGHPETLYEEPYYYDELKSLVENYYEIFECYPHIYRTMISRIYNCLIRIDKENNYTYLAARYVELLESMYNHLEEPLYEEYQEDLLSVYNAAYNLYYRTGSFEEAANYMCKMIAIEEKGSFRVDVVKRITHYTWIASYFEKNNNISYAITSYLKALDLAIDAVVENEDNRLESMIIYIYGELGGLYKINKNIKEARYYIKEKIQWIKMVLYDDSETYTPLLASAYLDLAKCYSSLVKVHLYLSRAMYYALQYPDNEICKRIISLSKKPKDNDIIDN